MFRVKLVHIWRRVKDAGRTIARAWQAWRNPARVLTTAVSVARCPACKQEVDHAHCWLWYGGNIWHRRCLDAVIDPLDSRPLNSSRQPDAREPGYTLPSGTVN